MGERPRVRLGLVEEGAPSGCPGKGAPSWDEGLSLLLDCPPCLLPPGTESPCVPGPSQLDLSLGQL